MTRAGVVRLRENLKRNARATATVKSPGLFAMPVDEAQELSSGTCIPAKNTQHRARDHRDAALVNTSRCHALVRSIDDHPDSPRLQDLIDAASDLRCEFFLNLKTSRIAIDHSCELADTDNLGGGQVAHVSSADDRRHVVFAVRFEFDVAQDDHFVITLDLLEGTSQIFGGIAG